MNKPSYILLLSGLKGLSVLRTAIEEKIHPKLVVIGTDEHVKCDYSEDITKLCLINNISYSNSFKVENVLDEDIVLAIAWRKMIYGLNKNLIIFHDSILPKYRGFSPLVNMLINGENVLGVTALYGDDNYDSGPIIFQQEINIEYPITINTAIQKVSQIYKNLARKIFRSAIHPLLLPSREQNRLDISYSVWRDNTDYKINWEWTSNKVLRHINAVSFPYRGATTMMNGVTLRITQAELVADEKIENRCPGKVLFNFDGYPIVMCGEGLIKLLEVHIEQQHTEKKFLPTNVLKIRFN